MNFDFDVRIRLSRQSPRLGKCVVLVLHQRLLHLLLASRSVPLDALYLPSCGVASSCKVVVALQTRWMWVSCIKLLRAFSLVDFLEEALLLPLGVTDIKRVAAVLALENAVAPGTC